MLDNKCPQCQRLMRTYEDDDHFYCDCGNMVHFNNARYLPVTAKDDRDHVEIDGRTYTVAAIKVMAKELDALRKRSLKMACENRRHLERSLGVCGDKHCVAECYEFYNEEPNYCPEVYSAVDVHDSIK